MKIHIPRPVYTRGGCEPSEQRDEGEKHGNQPGALQGAEHRQEGAAGEAEPASVATSGDQPKPRAVHEATVLVRPARAGHCIVPDRAAGSLAADADRGAGDLE